MVLACTVLGQGPYPALQVDASRPWPGISSASRTVPYAKSIGGTGLYDVSPIASRTGFNITNKLTGESNFVDVRRLSLVTQQANLNRYKQLITSYPTRSVVTNTGTVHPELKAHARQRGIDIYGNVVTGIDANNRKGKLHINTVAGIQNVKSQVLATRATGRAGAILGLMALMNDGQSARSLFNGDEPGSAYNITKLGVGTVGTFASLAEANMAMKVGYNTLKGSTKFLGGLKVLGIVGMVAGLGFESGDLIYQTYQGQISGYTLRVGLGKVGTTAAGGTGAALIGGWLGGVAGGAVGSILPIAGTAAGASIGGILGTTAGGVLGGWLSGRGYDAAVGTLNPINDPASQSQYAEFLLAHYSK